MTRPVDTTDLGNFGYISPEALSSGLTQDEYRAAETAREEDEADEYERQELARDWMADQAYHCWAEDF